jgi:hypothetical protein
MIASVLISDDGTTVTVDDALCDLEGNAFSCIESSELFNATTNFV